MAGTIFDSLQHTSTCNAPQTHFSALQHTETQTTYQSEYGANCFCVVSTPCNTLRFTATHCHTLPHTATHCDQDTSPYCNKKYTSISVWRELFLYILDSLQYSTTSCNALQYTAAHCNIQQRKNTYQF